MSDPNAQGTGSSLHSSDRGEGRSTLQVAPIGSSGEGDVNHTGESESTNWASLWGRTTKANGHGRLRQQAQKGRSGEEDFRSTRAALPSQAGWGAYLTSWRSGPLYSEHASSSSGTAEGKRDLASSSAEPLAAPAIDRPSQRSHSPSASPKKMPSPILQKGQTLRHQPSLAYESLSRIREAGGSVTAAAPPSLSVSASSSPIAPSHATLTPPTSLTSISPTASTAATSAGSASSGWFSSTSSYLSTFGRRSSAYTAGAAPPPAKTSRPPASTLRTALPRRSAPVAAKQTSKAQLGSIIWHAGVDDYDRHIFLFDSSAIPVSTDYDQLVSQVVEFLSPFAEEKNYVLVLFAGTPPSSRGAGVGPSRGTAELGPAPSTASRSFSDSSFLSYSSASTSSSAASAASARGPTWSQLWKAYHHPSLAQSRSIRKNLKLLLIVHPTFFTRNLIRLLGGVGNLLGVSDKFARKILQVDKGIFGGILSGVEERERVWKGALGWQNVSPAVVVPADLIEWDYGMWEDTRSKSGAGASSADGKPTASHGQRDDSVVFGASLEDLCARETAQRITHQSAPVTPSSMPFSNVPQVLKDCVGALYEHGHLSSPGLFRRSASAKRVKAIREAYNLGLRVRFDDGDADTCAALIKAFFRELKTPIWPEEAYAALENCPLPIVPNSVPNRTAAELATQIGPSTDSLVHQAELDETFTYIRETVFKRMSSTEALDSLAYTLRLLRDASTQAGSGGMMDAYNLSVVFTPNLVRSADIGRDLSVCAVRRIKVINEDPVSRSHSPARSHTTSSSSTMVALGTMISLCIICFDEIFGPLGLELPPEYTQGGEVESAIDKDAEISEASDSESSPGSFHEIVDDPMATIRIRRADDLSQRLYHGDASLSLDSEDAESSTLISSDSNSPNHKTRLGEGEGDGTITPAAGGRERFQTAQSTWLFRSRPDLLTPQATLRRPSLTASLTPSQQAQLDESFEISFGDLSMVTARVGDDDADDEGDEQDEHLDEGSSVGGEASSDLDDSKRRQAHGPPSTRVEQDSDPPPGSPSARHRSKRTSAGTTGESISSPLPPTLQAIFAPTSSATASPLLTSGNFEARRSQDGKGQPLGALDTLSAVSAGETMDHAEASSLSAPVDPSARSRQSSVAGCTVQLSGESVLGLFTR